MKIALEDEYTDIMRKAQRGLGKDTAHLAREADLDVAFVRRVAAGDEHPNEEQARAIGRALGLDPGKFADAVFRRWEPRADLPQDVRHHINAPHPSNGYLLFLQQTRLAALVDPAGMPERLLRAVADGPFHLRYVLITHKHADHCDATAEVARAFPEAQILIHRDDAHAIGDLARRALQLRDHEHVPFGDAEIRALHTPGHTDGSVCYLFRNLVFTGDTLFAGSVGGAYGDLSTYDDVLRSVRLRLFSLDEENVLLPGHGPPSTIAEEKAHNPFFSVS
ncbi:MAG: MBL fold metallo-hydrolase [bacterium]|nr:MBL fold metallo-hydrolase [bacterium]